MKTMWILPIIIKATPEELSEIKQKIEKVLTSHFSRIGLAQPINPIWEKAENSPIEEIKEAKIALLPIDSEQENS